MPLPFKGRIIDLSQEIYQGMPVYPGHLKTVIWTHMSHEECQRALGTGFSCETRRIMFCDHGPGRSRSFLSSIRNFPYS